MRIGTKLLLAYLGLIGIVALAALLALPRWVEGTVIAAERERLQKHVIGLAMELSHPARLRQLSNLNSPRSLLDDMLVDESVVIMNSACIVLRTTRADLQGKQICNPDRLGERPHVWQSDLPEVPGIGRALIVTSPLTMDGRGLQVGILRDLTFIQSLAKPITWRLNFVIGLMLCIALLVSAWLSREMTGRLQLTGQAARALAEGDLSKRAPTRGSDEIADLAGHFNHMADRLQTLVEGLRRSERLRKELLITVSHELRTPMTSIVGFAEAMRDGIVREESQRQRYCQIIAGEASRLNRMINDLFDMSKLDAGQVELRLQAIGVTTWLQECADRLQPIAENAGVKIALQCGPEVHDVRIWGDYDRLSQVVGNLVSNAIRFSPQEGQITLQARRESGDVLIEVIDQGPGLAPEEAQRVFERFYRNEKGKKGHVGAGLGLAIVKSLIEAQGGKVGVKSPPGAGATFWVRMPEVRT